jgi:hypothetical protein
MGTTSIIILRLRSIRKIRLFQPSDGYVLGVGRDLCNCLQKLLSQYSIHQLQQLMRSMQEGNAPFYTKSLKYVLTGMSKVKFSNYDAGEYEYTVDFDREIVFVVSVSGWTQQLSFDEIQQGKIFVHQS